MIQDNVLAFQKIIENVVRTKCLSRVHTKEQLLESFGSDVSAIYFYLERVFIVGNCNSVYIFVKTELKCFVSTFSDKVNILFQAETTKFSCCLDFTYPQNGLTCYFPQEMLKSA